MTSVTARKRHATRLILNVATLQCSYFYFFPMIVVP